MELRHVLWPVHCLELMQRFEIEHMCMADHSDRRTNMAACLQALDVLAEKRVDQIWSPRLRLDLDFHAQRLNSQDKGHGLRLAPSCFLTRDSVLWLGILEQLVCILNINLRSSGQSSWLQYGDVLCFLWSTNWIYMWYVEESRPLLWSSGQSFWLQNGDVLCFLWGTNWIYACYVEESRPPLWSGGQSSWLQNEDVLFPLRYELNLYMLYRRKYVYMLQTAKRAMFWEKSSVG
jgi:hypothetical protein